MNLETQERRRHVSDRRLATLPDRTGLTGRAVVDLTTQISTTDLGITEANMQMLHVAHEV